MNDSTASAAPSLRAATDEPILAVERISKEYYPVTFLGLHTKQRKRDTTTALRDISFTVAAGETVGLLGPNGAGKTTLLKIIATLIHPSSGTVRVCGEDSHAHSERVRAHLGLISCDERSFYWRLTGRQNLHFFGALFGLGNDEVVQRCRALLETLGLYDAIDRPYHAYSSGMKQKLAIVRGFISNPAVVLYDEPTRALDPISAHSIRQWIRDNRRTAPRQVHIIATNQLAEAESLCDRVLVINGGRVVAHGTFAELRHKWDVKDIETHHLTVTGLTAPVAAAAAPASGIVAVTSTPRDGAMFVTVRAVSGSDGLSLVMQEILAAGAIVVRCEFERAPMEDIFYSLVQGSRAPELNSQEAPA